jgi:hypothetical protein
MLSAFVNTGVTPFYRDPGFLTTNSSDLFDRNTGKQGYPEVAKAIISVAPSAVVPFLYYIKQMKTSVYSVLLMRKMFVCNKKGGMR